ncbi:MAG: hypothetical protein ACQGVC_07430 [Myxococcota bacterium]
MLSRYDDFPIHQTPEPVAHPASTDRNVYDRYWFNGYADDGEFYFGIGMGLYPNRGILDCGFSIVRGGEQHAFHGSRRAPDDPADTGVGPFRIEIVEPMREVRVVLEPNDTGIACDLTFTARTACVEEGRQTSRRDGRILMDATRFAQFGRWRGEVCYDGQTVAIDPARVYGTKDRSWGLRPVGEPDAGGAPSRSLPQVFFLWAPIHWQDQCSHYGLFDDGDGFTWHHDGMLVPAYESPDEIPGVVDPAVRPFQTVEHQIEYVPGTRRAARAEIALVAKDGERLEMQLEPLLCFRMKGIGYTHPEWGHGYWKGELATGGESWKCDDLEPMALENQHIQQVVRATRSDRPGTGIGVLEQIAFGPHAKYGFKGMLDPA